MSEQPEQPEPAFTWGECKVVPVTIVVRYATGQTRSFPDRNWRIDRVGDAVCLVIGRGIPCTFVPLDGVLSFDLTTDDEV